MKIINNNKKELPTEFTLTCTANYICHNIGRSHIVLNRQYKNVYMKNELIDTYDYVNKL